MNRFGLVCVILAVLAAPMRAERRQRPDMRPPAVPDAKARALCRQSETAYAAMNALHMNIVGEIMRENVPARPELAAKGGFSIHIDIRVQRPNKLRIEETMAVKSKPPTRTLLVSDGKTVWNWDSEKNTYTETPAPTKLAEIPSPFLAYDYPGISWLLGENAVYQAMRGKRDFPPKKGPLHDGLFMGYPLAVESPVTFAGVKTDALVVKTDALLGGIVSITKFYVARTDHLFRGMTKEIKGTDDKGHTLVTNRSQLRSTIVDLSPHFTDADFTFTAPPGATMRIQKRAGN